MRTSKEITDQFANLCAELGNAVLNFEMHKSNIIAKYVELNREMQEATKAEAEDLKKEAEEVKDPVVVFSREAAKPKETKLEKALKGKK